MAENIISSQIYKPNFKIRLQSNLFLLKNEICICTQLLSFRVYMYSFSIPYSLDFNQTNSKIK